MSKDVILKVENLSKIYQLGQFGTGTISQDLNQFFNTLRGKEDLNRLVTSNVLAESSKEFVHALEGLNFEIGSGEVVGVVGKNGAGKSTLLKILSKVTRPSTGKVMMKGKVSSLLEVGTGFHPELTGRENIFLNGAILGMSKSEVRRKLDEIVDFSGVAKYLDTPVKRYSSGMTVRLGFAVAAHLEPDILIVDEVLAVGDAEFQKKAIGKMEEVSKEAGRTVLIVSHNLSTIKELCSKCILLESGKQKMFGETTAILNEYTKLAKSETLRKERDYNNDFMEVSGLKVESESRLFNVDKPIKLSLDYKMKTTIERPLIRIDVVSLNGVKVCREDYKPAFADLEKNKRIELVIPSSFLNAGLYTVHVLFAEDRIRTLLHVKNAFEFEVLPNAELSYSDERDRNDGVVLSPLDVRLV